ncbi:hypothetical protein DFH06DRAFT_1137999 [Mycena polygramma]|nr:hypothetical protein DFH06DRAFT_1137999 [Mycena polygramma]
MGLEVVEKDAFAVYARQGWTAFLCMCKFVCSEHGCSAGVTWHSGISVKFKLETGSSSTEANEALTGGHGPKRYCKEEALNEVHEDGGGSGYSLRRWQHRAESTLEPDRALPQWERPTWLQA